MSGGSDNVFSRWSRRKQAARDGETTAPREDEHAPETIAPEEVAEPIGQPLAAGEPEAEQEPLPPIEDLTAESDISAFLRKGVPKALKSAALRRMWSLDPAIRDYIGPSEYAWDFNTPGSMAGFGPLDAKESVVDFLSTVQASLPESVPATSPAPTPTPHQPATDSPEQEANRASDGSAEAAPPDETQEPRQLPTSTQSTSRDSVEVSAESKETSQITAPRRHGRALPR